MISLIVARDKNGGIGKDGDLLCHISADLKRFKALTIGHDLIMGRKTFESLPGLLPNRRHMVITSQKDYKQSHDGIDVYHSVEDVCASLVEDKEYFVIGGASVYESFLPLAQRMYITEIHEEFAADTYFPQENKNEWAMTDRHDFEKTLSNKYAYSFVDYIRK